MLACGKEAIHARSTDQGHPLRHPHAARDAGFTLAAIVILALGIGAVTALFTVLDGVLLKPLSYGDPARTVAVVNRYVDRDIPRLTGGDLIDIGLTREAHRKKLRHYHGGELGVQVSGHAEFVGVRASSIQNSSRCSTRARSPAGRSPRMTRQRSAVVGLAFAQRHFGSADAALAQARLRREPSVSDRRRRAGGDAIPREHRSLDRDAPEPPNSNRTGHNYRAVGKLAAGVTLDNANARLAALASRLAAAFPASNKDKTFVAMPLRDNLVSDARTTLYALMAAVVLVLLIACANVANLMLARGAARARAMSIRAALGAGRHHVVGQLLIESVLLAAIACGLGVVLAYIGTQALLSGGTLSVPLPRLTDIRSIGACWRSAWGLCPHHSRFRSVPALRAARTDGREALQRAGTRGAAGRRSRRCAAGSSSRRSRWPTC